MSLSLVHTNANLKMNDDLYKTFIGGLGVMDKIHAGVGSNAIYCLYLQGINAMNQKTALFVVRNTPRRMGANQANSSTNVQLANGSFQGVQDLIIKPFGQNILKVNRPTNSQLTNIIVVLKLSKDGQTKSVSSIRLSDLRLLISSWTPPTLVASLV